MLTVTIVAACIAVYFGSQMLGNSDDYSVATMIEGE